MSNEAWYVLEDGTVGDPREIAPGADGILRHRDGRAVAYAPHGPRSRSVDAAKERSKAAKPAPKRAEPKAADHEPDAPPIRGRSMKAEDPAPGYKTR